VYFLLESSRAVVKCLPGSAETSALTPRTWTFQSTFITPDSCVKAAKETGSHFDETDERPQFEEADDVPPTDEMLGEIWAVGLSLQAPNNVDFWIWWAKNHWRLPRDTFPF